MKVSPENIMRKFPNIFFIYYWRHYWINPVFNFLLSLFGFQFKLSSPLSLSPLLSFPRAPPSIMLSNVAARRRSLSLSFSPNKRYFVSLSCLFLYLKTLLLLISSSFHLAENPKSLLRRQRRCPVVFVIFSYFLFVCHFVVGSLVLAIFALLSELISLPLSLLFFSRVHTVDCLLIAAALWRCYCFSSAPSNGTPTNVFCVQRFTRTHREKEREKGLSLMTTAIA